MPGEKRTRLDLFLVSVLALYLELVLIRWLASEIRVFAYFKNFPLFAAFIGLGLGCYVADRRPIRWGLAVVLLFGVSLAAAFSEALRLTDLFFPDPSLYTWRGSILSPNILERIRGYPLLGSLHGRVPDGLLLFLIGLTSFGMIAALFTAASALFYPIGQETGRLFGKHRPLTAYSINVAGALTGSLAFTLVSHLELGPLVWLGPSFAFLAYFAWKRGARLPAGASLAAFAVLAVLLALGRDRDERRVWSPYYRISLTPIRRGDRAADWKLCVNHDYFQRAVDLSDAAVAEAAELAPARRNYDLPYRLLGKLDRVLVVGAGMGNDAAAALRAGAREVVAVDIDPAILRLGRELHPEAPYADERVRLVTDDARAYFRRHAHDEAGARYDLVVFGLLDSQTALSSMSSVRLEFYVYTIESLREALRLADEEHGLAVITFSVGWRDWVGERLYETITEAVGAPPLVLETTGYDGGITFVAGPGLARIDRVRLGAIGARDLASGYANPRVWPCRDDWPFLYVNPNHWPWVYLVALALLIGLGSLLVRHAMRKTAPTEAASPGARVPRFDPHMFLMGAAFMLVETSAIARLSLVFGATWLVNAAVISAVMVMILGANALVGAGKAPGLRASYLLLLAALLAVFFVPFDAFMTVPGGRALAALLVALPVLFSSLVFATAFKGTPSAHLALGCNMLGAILGGAFEAASLAVGIRALALLAVGVYLLSALALARQRRARAGTDARSA